MGTLLYFKKRFGFFWYLLLLVLFQDLISFVLLDSVFSFFVCWHETMTFLLFHHKYLLLGLIHCILLWNHWKHVISALCWFLDCHLFTSSLCLTGVVENDSNAVLDASGFNRLDFTFFVLIFLKGIFIV